MHRSMEKHTNHFNAELGPGHGNILPPTLWATLRPLPLSPPSLSPKCPLFPELQSQHDVVINVVVLLICLSLW